MGVEIRSHKGEDKPFMDMPVTLLNLDDLIPHEQTIDHELDWFVEAVQESGMIHWPMLVDNKTKLILDGHHRTEGLRILSYKKAPAIVIDYMDEAIVQLDTWYPLVEQPLRKVIIQLKMAGLSAEEVDVGSLDMERVTSRKITGYVGNQDQLYEVAGERERIFRRVRDLWLNDIHYYDDPLACFEATKPGTTAIASWSYTKQEILTHVDQGIVHLPKTTRHILSYQVPKCNFQLSEL